MAELSGDVRLMEQLVAAYMSARNLDRCFGTGFSLRVYPSDCRVRVSFSGFQRVSPSPEWHLEVRAAGAHLSFLVGNETQVSALVRWTDIAEQLADIYPESALLMQE